MGYKKDMGQYEYLEGWERCSLGEQLEKWADKYKEKIAVADSEEEVSYKELNRRVKQMAGAFLYNGICKGDRVLVQLPHNPFLVMSGNHFLVFHPQKYFSNMKTFLSSLMPFQHTGSQDNALPPHMQKVQQTL